MAIFDKEPILKGFTNAFQFSGSEPAMGAAPASYDAEVLKRLEAMKAARAAPIPTAAAPVAPAAGVAGSAVEAGGVLSRIRSMGRALFGPVGAGVAMALHSSEAGAGSDVITNPVTGEARPSGGVPLSPEIMRRAGIRPGAPLSDTQIASVKSAADDAKLAQLAAQDAAAQKFTDARTARVNAVIAASEAGRAQDAREAQRENALQATVREPRTEFGAPMPNFELGRNFSGLSQLFAQAGRFAVARQQANMADRQNLLSEEKAKDRILDRDKVLATMAEKGKPDYKIATVKTLSGETSVITKNGEAKTAITMDERGNVTTQPVKARPTTAQAHAEAQAVIDRAPNKVAMKKQINERLKALGYPTL